MPTRVRQVYQIQWFAEGFDPDAPDPAERWRKDLWDTDYADTVEEVEAIAAHYAELEAEGE